MIATIGKPSWLPMEFFGDCDMRILCVEEDFRFQQRLKAGLAEYGFEVITASHGIDALRQYETNGGHFAYLICDHDMMKMSGLQLVRSVREMGYEGHIVVTSVHLSLEEFKAYEPFGISGFFSKPFEIGMLGALLSQRN